MVKYQKNPFEAYIQGKISQREMIEGLNKKNSVPKSLETQIKNYKPYHKPKTLTSNKEEVPF